MAACGLGLAALIGYAAWRAQPVAPQYVTAVVDIGSVAPAVVASGAVNPITTIQVGTYVSGVIQAVLCDFNTQVKAGQLCARIDPRPYQTVVEQEQAALAIAQAQAARDRANLDYALLLDRRNADLSRRGFVSTQSVDTSRNAYDQAKAQLAIDTAAVAQRQAALKAARINLGYTDIVSPVDGTVVSRSVTQGQTVAASFQTPTLFLVATDLTKMQVDTNVSESDIGQVRPGNAATFSVAAYPERPFAGTVTQVRQAPQTVQNVVTYDVVIGAPNPDLALKPGMTASVRIVPRRAAHVLRVPVQALRYRPTAGDGGKGDAPLRPEAAGQPGGRPGQVWVLAQHGPHRVVLSVGLEDDAYAQVLAGPLRAGDRVILSQHAAAGRRPGGAAPSGLAVPRR